MGITSPSAPFSLPPSPPYTSIVATNNCTTTMAADDDLPAIASDTRAHTLSQTDKRDIRGAGLAKRSIRRRVGKGAEEVIQEGVLEVGVVVADGKDDKLCKLGAVRPNDACRSKRQEQRQEGRECC